MLRQREIRPVQDQRPLVLLSHDVGEAAFFCCLSGSINALVAYRSQLAQSGPGPPAYWRALCLRPFGTLSWVSPCPDVYPKRLGHITTGPCTTDIWASWHNMSISRSILLRPDCPSSDEPGANARIPFFDTGRGWAAIALKSVFPAGVNQGIETLITQILHDYYLRIGDYAQAFLVSGMVARHFQLLQLSLEYDTDITCPTSRMKAPEKETRRSVAWACYLLDALTECGVDQLRFISASNIHVQLPCSEELFARNIPAVTETLSTGQTLPFLDG